MLQYSRTLLTHILWAYLSQRGIQNSDKKHAYVEIGLPDSNVSNRAIILIGLSETLTDP